IAYETFDRLDEALFAGKLKDAVYLDVRELGSYVSGATYNPGHGPDSRVSRITIVLNLAMHLTATPEHIIASLIHHMIHAYFLVACGPQKADELDYGRLNHGNHFGKIMYMIKNLSRSGGKCFPLDFGHELRMVRGNPYGLDYPHHASPSAFHNRSRKSQPPSDRSYCPHNAKEVEQAEIDVWYRGLCEPLLGLPDCVRGLVIYTLKDGEFMELQRAQAGRSDTFVELIFSGKALHVPIDKIAAHTSIREVFSKSRWLEIPEGVNLETFSALYDFLVNGSYGVDIGEMQTIDGKGPPLIKDFDLDSSQPLLLDIRVFKLAHDLKFEELQNVALQRINDQHITREDPVAVLREIYCDTPDPHADLRLWAHGFMTRYTTPAHFWTLTKPYDSSNLKELQQSNIHRSRFEKLVEHGGALHLDIAKAHEEL
ncbi:hypothetical protein K432DRAFT_277692, partial [Lepidopterella palustris CBS 459.81]